MKEHVRYLLLLLLPIFQTALLVFIVKAYLIWGVSHVDHFRSSGYYTLYQMSLFPITYTWIGLASTGAALFASDMIRMRHLEYILAPVIVGIVSQLLLPVIPPISHELSFFLYAYLIIGVCLAFFLRYSLRVSGIDTNLIIRYYLLLALFPALLIFLSPFARAMLLSYLS